MVHYSIIQLRDVLLSHIRHFPRFIDDLGKGYHVFNVILEEYYLTLKLLARMEDNAYRAPCFELHSSRPAHPQLSTQEWIMHMTEMSSAFSAKLTTVEELNISFRDDKSQNVIPWRRQFQGAPGAWHE